MNSKPKNISSIHDADSKNITEVKIHHIRFDISVSPSEADLFTMLRLILVT